MSQFQESVYKALPHAGQNALVTLFDFLQYRKRHAGRYHYWYEQYRHSKTFSEPQLKEEQLKLLEAFLHHAKKTSSYYAKVLAPLHLKGEALLENYRRIPIQSKEDVRSNIDAIYTIGKKDAILAKTGGTTGKSLEVRFTYDDMQNRYAMLDLFRAEYGYTLGQKVAWFSGKSLLTENDLHKNRYWKWDWLHRIRYYSTFHISARTIKHYIDDLNTYQPFFAVGFPSSIYEIARWGLENKYPLRYSMKALFPTAETIVPHEKEALELYFGGKVRNQYASSEGAPFILECPQGNLHMQLLSGYFEVLDSSGHPAADGDLVFTSFTTHGTPLIRYAIKDRLKLTDRKCTCGDNNPLVERIEGRVNDFIFSRERGKINLGNVSNSVKYVKGVVKFQVVQETEDAIEVKVVKDGTYSKKDEAMFLYELRERLGNGIVIRFSYVDDIPREASGKYRIVKNSLSF